MSTNMPQKIRIPRKEAVVLWLLLYHPGLTDGQIAEVAGCSRTSLYRMPFFNRMRKAQRESGAALLPRNGRDSGFEPVQRDDEEDANP